MKKKLEEGDIFYVERNGHYFFGKILLDVSERILKIEPENLGFKFFSGCCLAAVYKGIYKSPELVSNEIIIPNTFIFKKYFYSKKYKVDWTFYKHETIDYRDLDFPEGLQSVHHKGICLSKGELELRTNLTAEQFDNEYKIVKGIKGSFNSLIDYACHYQKREDLMDVISKNYLEWSDLRFAPEKRKEVYQQIGEDMNQSYYEMALKHGYDLGRFYQ
ncbi:hypothetical protein [Zobellia laminariae]|uniref:hypothetical protein n=1 Tax=Zobellia laminariae TaxID=248906 RepID=UPI0026F46E51|nr:hypothetical protein [Zobellia laminariae]WKX76185.1 hypothetical protein Q5W13_21880 [Zobellia laminariae]